MGHWLWTLFILCRGADRVIQLKMEVTAYEGEDVSLNCEYETSYTSPSLFWYSFSTNSYPEYVLRKDVIGPGDLSSRFKERFQANLSTKTNSVPLMIQRLQLSDSAVYYCALKISSKS
uniref:Ig-like domain-containing protein n=1 Tax=Esox lucius TaxID=8010 RepID=A0AAY5K3B4_ESOLU